MITDYEEQVLITGIKMNQQCSICHVPPNERENLSREWPMRTHEDTQERIQRQRMKNTPTNDPSYVHPRENFAWMHYGANIHAMMMVDILHQLHKGIMMNLILWVVALLTGLYPKKRKRRGRTDKRKIEEAPGETLLDHRFRHVPPHQGLKVFKHFSAVSQWTGVEQKALSRQLVGVVAPLLTKTKPNAMKCVRAFLDFIVLASYKSQDEDTLEYMAKALRRVDKLKAEFADFRPVSKETEEGHFNFSKFHVMSHYTKFIRLYGSADQFDTSHMEAAHKYLVKIFYQRTNKNENYQDQILWHNTRRINMLAMEDILYHMASQKRSDAAAKMRAYATRFSRAINLHKIGIRISKRVLRTVQLQGLGRGEWCTIRELKEQLEIPDLVDAAAVFVRESRKKRKECAKYNATEINRREKDPSWVEDFLVRVHASVKCWVKHGQNGENTEELKEETVRCSPAWRGKVGNWRRDHVWVRDEPGGTRPNLASNESTSLEMGLPGQLQICVSIRDVGLVDAEEKGTLHYGALVKVFRLRGNGSPDQIHGMFEVEHWPESQARNPRNLNHCRFYEPSSITRSAHLIPATIGREAEDTGPKIWYVNNYIDWESYNTYYDPEYWLLDPSSE